MSCSTQANCLALHFIFINNWLCPSWQFVHKLVYIFYEEVQKIARNVGRKTISCDFYLKKSGKENVVVIEMVDFSWKHVKIFLGNFVVEY